jgi:Tol biopolymer transport system component
MPLTSGQKLGPYTVQDQVGAGGMGEVYRAHDSRLNRVVAIKVLPASFSADHERLQRFAQEARAAAALNHPGILSIFDIGDDAGAPYVVSELLEGETLRDRVRTGALPLRKAIDYALQVARGLAAAHEKGIVHRDLKPENIFVTNDGRVKILDFGLAKLTQSESPAGLEAPTLQAATEPGMILGTIGYMSPEQVRGKPADARSDIFAFGAILYEMVSGKRAFHGETTADTLSAILKEEPPELSETARNVPPGLERVVRHCLEKNPAQRFQSTRDLAFDLEALTDLSSTNRAQTAALQATRSVSRRKMATLAVAVLLAIAILGFGGYIGRRTAIVAPPQYQQITFRLGAVGNARFTPDGSIIYSAVWDGGERQLYMARTDESGARELGFKNTELLAISNTGELALRLNTRSYGGYARSGTLARVPLSGGSPREVLDNVQDADWSADGQSMAVVRYVPESGHWRLEYPIGKVLFDSINWLSQPKISPDGKYVAFADHENPIGDDMGSVAVIGPDGKEKKLSSGWSSIEGILWSPSGNEIWFSASDSGSAENLRGITLSGKLREIVDVPGGMWVQDIRNGLVLMATHQQRIDIRGMAPGGKEEKELGWLGWSELRDISADGRKVLFEEEAEGGGPNYTVYLRDTDGTPPVRIGEGVGQAISPDGRWVVTQPAKKGALFVVPTGAGQAHQLTHDSITYGRAKFFPDGRRLLASGIEPGHGVRDYVIDMKTGDSKPLTPEGIAGTRISPDGRLIAVIGSDNNWGVWPTDGSAFRPIPGLDGNYYISGWSPDSAYVYAASSQSGAETGGVKVYRVNVATGKMDFWKSFGTNLPAGTLSVSAPMLSNDGNAYVYVHVQVLSEAYVVKGLK